MDLLSILPAELLDEIAYDELTYRGLLSIPVFARSLTIGRRFDFMIKFGHDFHVIQHYSGWFNAFTKNGERHRVDGPASEYNSGAKVWYINGQLHRVDGPAIEWADGSNHWSSNGITHRIDGPAIKHSDGTKGWFIYETRYTEEDHYLFTVNM